MIVGGWLPPRLLLSYTTLVGGCHQGCCCLTQRVVVNDHAGPSLVEGGYAFFGSGVDLRVAIAERGACGFVDGHVGVLLHSRVGGRVSTVARADCPQ